MKMIFFILLIEYFLIISVNTSCPDDEDLQYHRCICSAMDSSIQCSSLPNRCRTCYRYRAIYFDENVDLLPMEALSFYRFFDNEKNSFKIQFAQLKNISTKSFSKISIEQERILEIKILKYSSSIFPTQLFQNLTIETNAKFNIEIVNSTESMLTIKSYAFDGIQLHHQSQFRLSILHTRHSIQFESNAGSIVVPSYAHMEFDFRNFGQLLANEQSFDRIYQEESSKLIINFDHFQSARFSHRTFSNLHQLHQSHFHLSLSNFNHLKLDQTFFDTITQLESLLIISISNLTNDLCLTNQSFSHIKQEINSTFQLKINSGGNILFSSQSWNNITQNSLSKISILISNSYDVYFSQYSLKNFYQNNRAFIDIIIKYGQNLIFETSAIDLHRSSVLTIAFQYSRGTLQMARNAFSNINKDQGGELLFQLTDSSDFYIRFNQSISFQHLEILDRSLSSDDLCRISNIPSHIPIKLPYDNNCSCTIYYLYRNLLPSTLLKEFTPVCYSNMSLEQIQSAEIQCEFENKISNCQQMEGEIQINIPHGICQKEFEYNIPTKTTTSSSILSFLFFLILLGCLIFGITCIYILHSSSSCSKYFHHSSRHERLVVKYNSTTNEDK